MKTIMASELSKSIIDSIDQFGDGPIYATDYCPMINRMLPATNGDGDRCFFFTNEPEA